MSFSPSDISIGVDTGGTHTDLVLAGDGRLLTLEDTVEFFNLIIGTKLNEQEKQDLVAFLSAL